MSSNRKSTVLSSGGRNQVGNSARASSRNSQPSAAAAAQPKAPAAAAQMNTSAPLSVQPQPQPAAPAYAALAAMGVSAPLSQQPPQPQPQQLAPPQQATRSESPSRASPQQRRQRERQDPAEMKAAGLIAYDGGVVRFNESSGVVATMAGDSEFRKTAQSVSRETYKVLSGKPAVPFKARTSAFKDPIAHSDAAGAKENPQWQAQERSRFTSESNSHFVDHYQLHGDQVNAGRAVRPAAITASMAVRASGPFEGETVSQAAFQNFAAKGELNPPKSFKPPPQKLDLVVEDRDFQSVQRQQQDKTWKLAQNEAKVNILVKNSVSLKNFRGTGAAAAMAFGSPPGLGMGNEVKSTSQASFSKFTSQQQQNAKARDPSKLRAVPPAGTIRSTNTQPNTEFAHVRHNEDAPLAAPPAGQSSGAPIAAPVPVAAVAASASSSAALAAAKSPIAAGMKSQGPPSARSKGSGAVQSTTTSKAGYNIISSLNAKEEQKWSSANSQAMRSVASGDFVRAGADFEPAKSYKPQLNGAPATAAAFNGGKADPAHSSQQWVTEGHSQFAGKQSADANMRAKRGGAQGVAHQSAPLPQVPFEGRSTAAESYAARPKRK